MLTELLALRPGISAFIGSGGKTSLIGLCARELADNGKKVIVCTTTHIYPFPDMPLCLTKSYGTDPNLLPLFGSGKGAAVCIGTPAADGKLTAPAVSLRRLLDLADHILVEADGSARHPLKAHASHEPVIPEDAEDVICVFGLGGFGRPIKEAVHRSGLFIRQLTQNGRYFDAGVFENEAASRPVTPEMAAAVFEAEKTGAGTIFLNQADLPGADKAADAFIRALKDGPYRIVTGSALKGTAVTAFPPPPR